jgi:hypothetical protein
LTSRPAAIFRFPMGTAPDAVKRLIEARDMTETRDTTQFRRGIGIVSQVPLKPLAPTPSCAVLG